MIEIVRTNNPVLISFIEATLTEADLFVAVLDSNASIIEGSVGMLPRRIMISEEDAVAVRKLLSGTEAQDELLPGFLEQT